MPLSRKSRLNRRNFQVSSLNQTVKHRPKDGGSTAKPLAEYKRKMKMCLQAYAIPAQENRVSAQRLSTLSGLRVEKLNKPYKGALYFSRDGGCSCSLLSDNADWNEPVWELEPEVLEPLAKALQVLGDEAGGFTFQAIWIGDSAETANESTLSEVLQEIRNNKIRNKHIYKVTTDQVVTASNK